MWTKNVKRQHRNYNSAVSHFYTIKLFILEASLIYTKKKIHDSFSNGLPIYVASKRDHSPYLAFAIFFVLL